MNGKAAARRFIHHRIGYLLAIPLLIGPGCVNDASMEDQGPPDGGGSGRILYCYQPVSGPDLDKSIRVIGVDGSGDAAVADLAVSVNAPDFSPTGSHFALYGYPSDTTWSIYTVRNDGSDLQRLTTTEGVWDHVPDFSPDGSRIVFSRIYPNEGMRSEVWVMNTDGTEQHHIGIAGDGAVWSPNGTRLAYADDREGHHD
ncbi:TolB family protein, partial [Gemmatimonadota bacterium]